MRYEVGSLPQKRLKGTAQEFRTALTHDMGENSEFLASS